MAGFGKQSFAATVVFGLAVLFLGLGVRLSTADEPKAPDLTELRDAVKVASKRGDNVDEVQKALDALEKALAKGFTAPVGGRTLPAPRELAALRDAVEAAGRKGENVTEIRKQLELVEKAITGKVLTPPKPVQPPAEFNPPVRPGFRPEGFPQPVPFPFPNIAPGGGLNPADIQKAQEQMLKAMEALLKNPNDPDAQKLLNETRDMMLKAMGGGGLGGLGGLGGGFAIPENFPLPDFNLPNQGFARVPERFRLGVRMERLTPLVVEQLGLERGQGVALTEVIEGTAAERAGFKVHDIVIEFAGKPVSENTEDFARQVNDVKPGEAVNAVVLRKGKKIEVKGIELPAMQQAPVRPLPGRRGADLLPVPVPQKRPAPLLPNPPEVRPDDNLGRLAPARGNFSVTNSNGNFTIKAEQNGVKYTLQGTTENGTPKLTDAVIDVDGKETKADSLEKVPETHRAAVERLLKSAVGRTTLRR